MHAILPLAVAAVAMVSQPLLGQGSVVSDDRLPSDSIELKRNDPPATSTPWQLPKPGDSVYDAEKEEQIKRENEAAAKGNSHLVHVFERGVFKGYQTLSWGKPGEKAAKEMNDAFIANAKLPPDAVQLSASAQPDKSDYFPTHPKTRPPNVPPDCIAVRVFHRGKFIGWTFMPKTAVAQLHTRLKVRVTHFAYPGDQHATNEMQLGLGDHNNTLNKDSVAVTPDLDGVFPFGSKVYVEGKFLGFRHTTLSAKLHHTIAVYDPNGEWTEDFDSYVEIPVKQK